MDISLVMVKADGTRRVFPFQSSRIIIGRQRTCELRIPLHSVSRKHCELSVNDQEQIMVRDLGSSNGTLHNDQRISGPRQMAPGDRLQLGPVVFTLVVDGLPEVVDPSMTLIAQAQKVQKQQTSLQKAKSKASAAATAASSASRSAVPQRDDADASDQGLLLAEQDGSGVTEASSSDVKSRPLVATDNMMGALEDRAQELEPDLPPSQEIESDTMTETAEVLLDDEAEDDDQAIEDAMLATLEVEAVDDDDAMLTPLDEDRQPLQEDMPFTDLHSLADSNVDDDGLFKLDDTAHPTN